MYQCQECRKFKPEIDENGVCYQCGLRAARDVIHLSMSKMPPNRRIPYRADGQILGQETWIRIKREIDTYYNGVSMDDIDEHNKHIVEMKRQRIRYPSSPAVPGYVYLIESSVGYHKLGKALDPDHRLKEHGRDYPISLEVVHTIQCRDYTRCERFLLDTFKEKKVRGEWFNLDNDDVRWIKSLDTGTLESLAGVDNAA